MKTCVFQELLTNPLHVVTVIWPNLWVNAPCKHTSRKYHAETPSMFPVAEIWAALLTHCISVTSDLYFDRKCQSPVTPQQHCIKRDWVLNSANIWLFMSWIDPNTSKRPRLKHAVKRSIFPPDEERLRLYSCWSRQVPTASHAIKRPAFVWRRWRSRTTTLWEWQGPKNSGPTLPPWLKGQRQLLPFCSL